MKGRGLLKIIFCFLLFQTVTGNQSIDCRFIRSVAVPGSQPSDKGEEMPEET